MSAVPIDPSRITIRNFDGPNLLAPFAAIAAEFRDPLPVPLPVDKVEGYLRAFLNPQLMQHVRLPVPAGTFAAVAAAIGNALQDNVGPNDLAALATRDADGTHRVLLEYLDPQPTRLALQAGLDLASALFTQASGQRFDAAGLGARLKQAVTRITARQPDPLARALIRAARRRGIPVYPVAPGSRLWIYGQGRAGLQCFEVANHHDALTGSRLARNKFNSNQLVKRLGLPGVHHHIANSGDAARHAARELGYPLVVKPLASGKGAGVTAHITTEAELLKAFEAAHRIAKTDDDGRVLIERHVSGDDHRMVVIGGRLLWAVRRSPPRIRGDGQSTVSELLEAENRRRAASPVASIASAPLVLDDEMRSLLSAQQLTPTDRPAAGRDIQLRRIANIARGGTLVDCTADVHPDNRAMAETIARSFHLDAIGIDFMTPDVSRSWREIDCAVLEVNATPGFSSDERAAQIIDTQFPSGATGRIPSILLVDLGDSMLEKVRAFAESLVPMTGSTDAHSTHLASLHRFSNATPLADRIRGLLLDAGCAAIIVAIIAKEIELQGLPLDRFDLVLAGPRAALSEPLAELIENCATRTLWGAESYADAALSGELTQVLESAAAATCDGLNPEVAS